MIPSYRCTGSPFKLFGNWNGTGVQNGAAPPTFSTRGRAYCVTSMSTYHWNNARGKAPGTVGARTIRGLGGAGNVFGPWPAKGSPGQGGAPNVNWTATTAVGQIAVINGVYACQDSDPGTWSQNQASRGRGFCTVNVRRAIRTNPPPPPPPPFQCLGGQITLFNSWNVFSVFNGAKPPTFSTNGRSYCVQSISDYHWNNGQGKTPGTIGLGVVQGLGGAGRTLGPWPAAGSTGQGGAANVNWTASPPANKVVINGTYACNDSDPASWSMNQASGGHGFCAVYAQNAVVAIGGVPLPAPPPPPAPGGGGHPTCTPTPPSSFLIFPNHVSPGGLTSFLLWCGRPTSLGFRGAFAPLAVLMYDWASFRNQQFVKGYLQPVSPSFPVRPPIPLSYAVIGPNDIDVILPAGVLPGIYVPLIVWAKGMVPSQNLLAVP